MKVKKKNNLRQVNAWISEYEITCFNVRLKKDKQ